MSKILMRLCLLAAAMMAFATVAFAGGDGFPVAKAAEGYYLVEHTRGTYDSDGNFALDENYCIKHSYEFDDSGNIVVHNANTYYDEECVWHEENIYEYDALGNCVIRKSLHQGEMFSVTCYQYNSAGDMSKCIKGNYDNNGEFVAEWEQEYIYDAEGRLIQMGSILYYYNEFGNCIKEEQSDGIGWERVYEYTQEGVVVTESSVSANIRYTYDKNDRLTNYYSEYYRINMTDDGEFVSDGKLLLVYDVTYEYDAYGNNIKMDIYQWAWEGETAAEYYMAEIYEYAKLRPEEESLPAPNPFTDVDEGRFYYEPVLWAVENQITKGETDTTFAPDKDCTRGQVVTFLWRAAGSPEPESTECAFTDVRKGAYYYKAMLWAVENGITMGKSDTSFAPDDTCTRGEVVTFLWRAAQKPANESSENPFADVASGRFYYKPVLWAVENDITKGITSTAFNPEDTCNRGQVVTFLYRWAG